MFFAHRPKFFMKYYRLSNTYLMSTSCKSWLRNYKNYYSTPSNLVITLTIPSISSSVGGLAEFDANTRLIGSMRRDNDLFRKALSNCDNVSRKAFSALQQHKTLTCSTTKDTKHWLAALQKTQNIDLQHYSNTKHWLAALQKTQNIDLQHYSNTKHWLIELQQHKTSTYSTTKDTIHWHTAPQRNKKSPYNTTKKQNIDLQHYQNTEHWYTVLLQHTQNTDLQRNKASTYNTTKY